MALRALCILKCTATHSKRSSRRLCTQASFVESDNAKTTEPQMRLSTFKYLWGRERENLHPPAPSSNYTSIHPHRSILQHELQGGVAIFVVLVQLGGLPHLLGIGDPHPSPLEGEKETESDTEGWTQIRPSCLLCLLFIAIFTSFEHSTQ